MNESIIKTDRCGRMRYTPEQKQTMLDAYRASGLIAPRFVALHGVNYQTLVSWIKKEKIQDPDALSRSRHSPLLSLVPAAIDASHAIAADCAMEVLLPGVQRQLKLSSTTIKTGHWRQLDWGAIQGVR